MSRCASRKDVGQVRRERSSTRKPRRVRKKGGLARSFGLRRGQEDQRSQAAHPGRHVGSAVERCRSSRRRSRPRWSIPSVAPGTPTVPLHQAHLCRRWLCGRENGARLVAHRDMEAGDCEATRYHRFRDLVQKMDRRKDFAWISRNRRLARDFERYATTVAAFVRLAMIRIMLRRLAAANSSSSRMGSEGCRRAEKTLIASVFINVDKSRNALDLT